MGTETKTVMNTATFQKPSHTGILRKMILFCLLRKCKMVRTAKLQRTTMMHPANAPNRKLSDLELLAKQLARSPKMYQKSWLRAITAPLPTMKTQGRMSGTPWMTSQKGAKRLIES